MEHLIHVLLAFVSVVHQMPVVFQVNYVAQAPVNAVLQQVVLDKRPEHTVMQQIIYVNALRRSQLAVEHRILALAAFANAVHPMLAVFPGKHVALDLVNVVLRLAVLD